jgi:putative membrane protein
MVGAWSAVGAQAASGSVWTVLGVVGPSVCAAVLLFFVVRAIVRHGRYRVVASFDGEDERAVREAVAEAERRTVGEILPVVVERSDGHPGADWMAALAFVLVGSALLAPWLPWSHPVLVLLAQLAMGGIGFLLARLLPDLKRVFVFEDRATEVAGEQAFQEFYRNGLHKTEAATGVLMFVSLLERRVVVMADEGIDSRVDATFWADTDELVLDGIRKGSLREGLVAGIRKAGERLAGDFPWTAGDRNEIPDRVIVRKE